MNHKQGSIYHKLLFLFTMTMIPCLIIGTIALFSAANHIRTDAIRKESLQTSNIVSQLDSTINNMYKNSIRLLSDSNVLKLANRPEQLAPYESILTLNNIREQLTNLKTSNSLAAYVRIYFKKVERVYNSANYPYGSFQIITIADYEKLEEESLNMTRMDAMGNLSMLAPVSPFHDSSSIIETALSVRELETILGNLTVGTEDYYLLHVPSCDFLLHNLPASLEAYSQEILTSIEPEQKEIHLGKSRYLLFRETVSSLNGTVFRLISAKDSFASTQLMFVFLVIFLFLIFVGCLAFFIITRRMIKTPLFELISGLEEIEKGNYSVQIKYHAKNEFSYLYRTFNRMALNINQSIERDYKNKLLLQQAELKQLQAQVNPHFLYNSFFMLQRIIQSGLQDEAVEITELLGQYFRYLTQNSANLIPLHEEYEHARIYSQIQEMRFAKRIHVHFQELPASYASAMVPKLILQPILENAYKYALENQVAHGELRIFFTDELKYFHILIEDNGTELSESKLNELREQLERARTDSVPNLHGLMNICRRLVIFSDGRANMTVRRAAMGGLSVCITIAKEDSPYEPHSDCR